jgi:hypothetical protein
VSGASGHCDGARAQQEWRMLRLPLLRLLALNLALGIVLAMLTLGGLMLIDARLRVLLLAERTGLVLLAFGLVVTFCSVTMGSAIMALGRRDPDA